MWIYPTKSPGFTFSTGCTLKFGVLILWGPVLPDGKLTGFIGPKTRQRPICEFDVRLT